jgi:hypothetical protein
VALYVEVYVKIFEFSIIIENYIYILDWEKILLRQIHFKQVFSFKIQIWGTIVIGYIKSIKFLSLFFFIIIIQTNYFEK